MRVCIRVLVMCALISGVAPAQAKASTDAPVQQAPKLTRWEKIKAYLYEHREAIASSVVVAGVVAVILHLLHQKEAAAQDTRHATQLAAVRADVSRRHATELASVRASFRKRLTTLREGCVSLREENKSVRASFAEQMADAMRVFEQTKAQVASAIKQREADVADTEATLRHKLARKEKRVELDRKTIVELTAENDRLLDDMKRFAASIPPATNFNFSPSPERPSKYDDSDMPSTEGRTPPGGADRNPSGLPPRHPGDPVAKSPARQPLRRRLSLDGLPVPGQQPPGEH